MYRHYEINVSKNGRHYFATAPRSIETTAELDKIYYHFKRLFPEKEGYSLMVSKIVEKGTILDEQGILNEIGK